MTCESFAGPFWLFGPFALEAKREKGDKKRAQTDSGGGARETRITE